MELERLVNVLFDEMKARHGLTSDAALARHLSEISGQQVHQMAILRWRRGEFPKGLEVLGPQLIVYAENLRQPAA